MANEQNLKPQNTRTKKEQREIARKGGIASGEARRRNSSLKKALLTLLESDVPVKGGNAISGADAVALELFKKALKGDLRAIEIMRDTAGQRPTDQMQVEVERKGNDALDQIIEQLKANNNAKGNKD